MITIHSPQDWNRSWDSPENGSLLISLQDCGTQADVLMAIGHVIKGQDSPTIHGRSLDALIDVMGDWFIENWGTTKVIHVTGGDHLFTLGRTFAIKVIQCFNDAFAAAIYDRALNHAADGICEELNRVCVYVELT